MEEQESFIPGPIKPKKRNPVVFIVAFVFIIGILLFGYKKFFSSNNDSPKNEITPTPTEFQFPTDTPTPSQSVSETPSPTEKAEVTPVDKKSGLDRSELNIEVQNGSGEKLVASKMSEVLKTLGYHVTSVGNADNFDYEDITISVKPSFSKYLSLLKSDLSSEYAVGAATSDLSASSSADARVIVGK